MTDQQYAIPSTGGGDKLPLAELLGALLRIDVLEALSDVQTSFGPAHPVRCNVAVLDGDQKAATFDDTLIFPRVLVSQLKPSVGKVVVGRLGRGTAKPGQSAPWTLTAPTDDDIATARKYDAYVAEQTTKQDEPW
jgi:hypothetical protein